MIREYKGALGNFQYDDTEFELVSNPDIEFLRYVGRGGKVNQPKGCTNMMCMFIYCTAKQLDLTGWDVHQVKNFDECFAHCEQLESLTGLEIWDTSSMVSANSMFCGCKVLKTLDLNKWNTANLEDASGMFCDCINLEQLNVASWDMHSCTDLSYFVNGCSKLQSLDVSHWKTTRLTNVVKFACSCESLKELDVSEWDAQWVERLHGMLANCPKLPEQDFSKWEISEAAISKIYFDVHDGVTTMSIF